ncbi:ABC transporter substrate binding protein [Corticibacter populi]|uniref:ABC transporter substrate binding protein n=1 Tax=Corticibacter populi TaxID=1550736 RepID=UPI0013C2BEAD|nr:ABC transporter substrate binding protein [Corticibacter populi]
MALTLALGAVLYPAGASAGDLQLITQRGSPTASDSYDGFVQQLRTLVAQQGETGERVQVIDLGSPRLPQAGDGDSVLGGVRTRSIPAPRRAAAGGGPASPAPGPASGSGSGRDVQIAVGPRAARSLLDAGDGSTPLLLALLSRMEYEALRQHPALLAPRRPIAILLRDPAPALQLALALAILPADARLGVVASADIDPLVQDLLQAAGPRDLVIGYAASASELAGVLQEVFQQADALLILSERLGNDANAGLSILHAASAQRKPAFATSEASVRAGALAAAAPDQRQLAEQALALGRRLARDRPAGGPWLEYAYPVSVYTNPSVATRLDIALPDAAQLSEHLHAAR